MNRSVPIAGIVLRIDSRKDRMEKPTARGPSTNRKAKRVLQSKLNRKDKPAPSLPPERQQQSSTSRSVPRSQIENSL
jgi:hypothetical protein